MLKCINPKKTWEYHPANMEDTIFEYKALTGASVISSMGADALFNHMIDSCVLSITNIELEVRKRDEKGRFTKNADGEYETEMLQFELFEPKSYPEIKLSQVLPSTICNALGSAIWEVSKISKVESGE